MGAQIKNQDYNDQVKQEGKNKKNDKKPHSNQGECVEWTMKLTLPQPETKALPLGRAPV